MKHYRIKIEIWTATGVNLGTIVHEMNFDAVEEAITEARKMYVEIFPKIRSKQLQIFTKDGLVWSFLKGKVKTFSPAPLQKNNVPVGNIKVEPEKENS